VKSMLLGLGELLSRELDNLTMLEGILRRHPKEISGCDDVGIRESLEEHEECIRRLRHIEETPRRDRGFVLSLK